MADSLDPTARVGVGTQRLNFRDFIREVNPGFKFYRHTEILIDALQRVADGEVDRLLVFMPPRHTKSELVSRLFSAYYLYCHPERFVGLCSYGADLAYSLSRNARDNYARAGGRLRGDAWAVKQWLTAGGGGLWAAGVGGPITGKGFHCFPGDTRVMTSRGIMKIETLCQSSDERKVLSFNHATNELEWRRIIATAVQPGKPLVEVALSGGGRIRCTADHPVYSIERGYRQAGDLVPGETVIQVEGFQSLRAVRVDNESPCPLRSVPTRHQRHSLPNPLRPLREGVHPAALPSREVSGVELRRSVLFNRVQPSSPRSEESKGVQGMWQSSRNQEEPILCGLSSNTPQGSTAARGAAVPILWGDVPAQNIKAGALLQGVCEFRPFDSDAWEGEQPLQDRNQLCRLVPQNEADHSRKGRAVLRHLRGVGGFTEGQAGDRSAGAFDFGDSSYRSQSGKQCRGESDNDVLGVSFNSSQNHGCWQTDTVSSVTRLSEVPNAVYDIQVEGNRNFFAEGILVHNCGIIDDPLKNAEDAASPTIQLKQQDWYGSTFYTRGEPGNAIIVIQTRWNEADLSGWLLKQEVDEEAEDWHIINMPAIAEEQPQKFPENCTVIPDFRQPGEALCPERYTLEKLLKLAKRIGTYFFNALYQQRPSAVEGAILKRQWWRFWVPKGESPPPVQTRLPDGTLHEHPQVELPDIFDEVLQSWDMTFKETKGSDFVCGQVWAKVEADKYLLDQDMERMDIIKTIAAVERMSEKWPESNAKLVEDKANGPAVIAMLRHRIAGLIPVEPEGSKESRVHSVAPEIESGNVYLPHPAFAPWVNAFIDSCAAFPNASHDDDVDSMTQALRRWNVGWWLA